MVGAQLETVITRFQVMRRKHTATLRSDDELNIGSIKWNYFFLEAKELVNP